MAYTPTTTVASEKNPLVLGNGELVGDKLPKEGIMPLPLELTGNGLDGLLASKQTNAEETPSEAVDIPNRNESLRENNLQSAKPEVHHGATSSSPGRRKPENLKTSSVQGEIVPLNDIKPPVDDAKPLHNSQRSFSSRRSESASSIPVGVASPSSIAPSPDSITPASPTFHSPLFGSGSRRRKEKSEREVLVGTPVKEGHVNYMLMYDMLTGIRISVSRCNAKPKREVVAQDFTAAHKLAFDVTGNEMTPSSKYDFKFKDYAPWVFRMIREAFHVDPAYYLLSLTGKYVLSELVSSGKSGSFFYYSQDYRFIIKTIHHSEHKFLLKILTNYYSHIKTYPHTLMSRIFGLHRVKLPGNRKIHFVVMGNVFPANKDIHEVFDLKGSSLGRSIPDEEARSNPRAVMKDLNWLDRGKKLHLGPEKRALLEKQMEADVAVCRRR
ncbi:Phosphatidylinositol-4-phosphate 5-kinase [Kappamyces sp. JEL0680]|nr:Phosphatidylinositol-4-phosphate 5-kinase [Kappamyces sp. JEL0680]